MPKIGGGNDEAVRGQLSSLEQAACWLQFRSCDYFTSHAHRFLDTAGSLRQYPPTVDV
jgi:hypothetical protein